MNKIGLVWLLSVVCSLLGTMSLSAAEDFASDEVFKRLTLPAPEIVPVVKNLDRAWVAKLADRGEPEIYTRENSNNFAYLGMPVGGVGAGQLYLSGDGRLWWWDIFNTSVPERRFPVEQGAIYTKPPTPESAWGFGRVKSPPAQGFTISVADIGPKVEKQLSAVGFDDIKFRGQYPVATVDFADQKLPLTVRLEAFSPFIPTNLADSSLPVTIFRYAVTNTSSRPLTVTVSGYLENAVLRSFGRPAAELLENVTVSGGAAKMLVCRVSSAKVAAYGKSDTPDVPVEDWSAKDFSSAGWVVTGSAFGAGPVNKTDLPGGLTAVGGDTPRVVNSYAPANSDKPTGALRREVALERDYLLFWLGGGRANGVYATLTVGGKEVRRAVNSDNDNTLKVVAWDVREWRGQRAEIALVDDSSEGWGQLGVGRIWQSNQPMVRPDSARDLGSMALAAVGDPLTVSVTEALTVNDGEGPAAPVGGVAQTLTVSPGATQNFDFALAWHFPDTQMPGLKENRRSYATRFADAPAVANYVAENFSRLSAATLLWRDTWNDSTLPHWFLNRAFASLSNLASSSTYLLGQEGRYYAYEGVYSCPGTCTHVYHYSQGQARIFPEMERATREHVDLSDSVAFNKDNGIMGFRAEFDRGFAVDGQAGTLLRIYREHLMAADGEFLQRNWEKIKLAYAPLFKLDADGDGILEGAQMNTLDQPWYGKIAWLSGLYNAALLAGERMALAVNDREFAEKCARVAAAGQRNMAAQLFNGEYFINIIDEKNPDHVNSGSGVEIDQLLGEAWARQVGLGRVFRADQSRSALRALFKYNFTTDNGVYRAKHKDGRWYALAGEAGLLMCTLPDPKWQFEQVNGSKKGGYAFYMNECWTGTEHAVAALMLWENLLPEALAVERAVHDRYDGAKRNPWSEAECGGHYGRALSSYGVFIAACGFHLDGPAGKMEFAPRLSAENFRAAFTAPAGWGSFSQKISADGELTASVELKYGALTLSELTVSAPGKPQAATAELDGKPLTVKLTVSDDGKAALSFAPLTLSAGAKLTVRLAAK